VLRFSSYLTKGYLFYVTFVQIVNVDKLANAFIIFFVNATLLTSFYDLCSFYK